MTEQAGLSLRPARYRGDLDFNVPENADIRNISGLLAVYASEQLLLPRPPSDVAERFRNFRVAEKDGVFAGCAAVRDYGNGLFEIRSLAVKKEFSGQGIGTFILENIISSMRKTGGKVRLFALTYRAELFRRLGFRIVDKKMFPGKIWSDCSVCAKKDCCDETAVLLELES